MINHAVPIKETLITIPQYIATDIVSAVYDVGDFMKEEIARLNLVSGNYKPGLFWSKLNTNVIQATGSFDCDSVIVKAGYHEFLLVEHKGVALAFMRETRFADVSTDVKTKGKLSYQNLLVQHLNSAFEAEVSQMSLFPVQEYDNNEVLERLGKLFRNAQGCMDGVGCYVMVLFDTDSFYTLRRIKAVLVDSNFDIVEEQDWSNLINLKVPAIVEKVSDTASPSNNPFRGLSLSPKALARKSLQNGFSTNADKAPEKD